MERVPIYYNYKKKRGYQRLCSVVDYEKLLMNTFKHKTSDFMAFSYEKKDTVLELF